MLDIEFISMKEKKTNWTLKNNELDIIKYYRLVITE